MKKNLRINLPPWSDRPHAVNNVSLSVSMGEILCIVGESGSGKSMLGKALMGLLPKPHVHVSGGQVHFEGRDITNLDETEWRSLRGHRIAMISIPVSAAAHANIGKISRFLCFAAFLFFAAMLTYGAIGGYFSSNAILKDHSVVTAPVTLEDIEEERGRKGRKSYTYHFSYAFEAGGQAHHGHGGLEYDGLPPHALQLGDSTFVRTGLAQWLA